MATAQITLNSTSSLTGVQFQPDLNSTDAASILTNIRNDLVTPTSGIFPQYPGAFFKGGIVYFPNRGQLSVRPGDWICWDQQGYPFCIPSASLPTTAQLRLAAVSSFMITASTSGTLPSAAGWIPGMVISTGTTIVANGTFITKISSYTITINASAINAPSSIATNAGPWSHS